MGTMEKCLNLHISGLKFEFFDTVVACVCEKLPG